MKQAPATLCRRSPASTSLPYMYAVPFCIPYLSPHLWSVSTLQALYLRDYRLLRPLRTLKVTIYITDHSSSPPCGMSCFVDDSIMKCWMLPRNDNKPNTLLLLVPVLEGSKGDNSASSQDEGKSRTHQSTGKRKSRRAYTSIDRGPW